jgi:glycosyltransferase involved in cell wall biosynthesis
MGPRVRRRADRARGRPDRDVIRRAPDEAYSGATSLPLVTIMIPAFCQADTIGEAIASALAQDYPSLEVLVHDNASPDDTYRAIERAAQNSRARVRRNPTNLGRVGNYRSLLDAARGEWVLNLDGDDVLIDPGFVSAAMREVRPATVLVIGGQRSLEADGRYRERVPTRIAVQRVHGYRFFLRWRSPEQVVPHLASLYRRDRARAIGFYTHDIQSSDWESLRRLCLEGDVVLLGRIAGEWRGHELNASKALDPEAHLANLDSILSPYAAARAAGKRGKRLRRWLNGALRRYVSTYLNAVMTQGDPASAAKFTRLLVERFGFKARLGVTLIWLTSPSLWFKALLFGLGGKRALEAARGVWQRWTWSRS